jgi:hypothetical protein
MLPQVVPQLDIEVRSTSQPSSELSSQLRVLLGQAVHAPEAQVWLVLQATALPHWPSAAHGWTPLPEQLVCPGPHTPLQLAVAPDSMQVLLALQVESIVELRPLLAHFFTSCPWQEVALGVQT